MSSVIDVEQAREDFDSVRQQRLAVLEQSIRRQEAELEQRELARQAPPTPAMKARQLIRVLTMTGCCVLMLTASFASSVVHQDVKVNVSNDGMIQSPIVSRIDMGVWLSTLSWSNGNRQVWTVSRGMLDVSDDFLNTTLGWLPASTEGIFADSPREGWVFLGVLSGYMLGAVVGAMILAWVTLPCKSLWKRSSFGTLNAYLVAHVLMVFVGLVLLGAMSYRAELVCVDAPPCSIEVEWSRDTGYILQMVFSMLCSASFLVSELWFWFKIPKSERI